MMTTLLLSLLGQALAGPNVFLPQVTPSTSDDFTDAVVLESLVYDRLIEDGYGVLRHAEAVETVGPSAIERCADQPACPSAILTALPVELAVVLSFGREGAAPVGSFTVYAQGIDTPVFSGTKSLTSTNPGLIVEAIAHALEEVTRNMTLHSGANAAPLSPANDESRPSVARQAPLAGVSRPTGKLPDGVAPRHLVGSKRHFEKLGVDARDWMYRAMPHAGRFTMEIRGGIGSGDVDRAADVRVIVENGGQVVDWYREGPGAARRARGEIFIGYAPTSWFDFGLVAGLQYGERDLTSGVVRNADDLVPDQSVSSSPDIQAVQALVAPRVRFYPVPVGPAKPFLYAGVEFRMFDEYNLQQPAVVTYPTPPGGVMPGLSGGAGLMIDPGPIVGFFFEWGYTFHLGERSEVISTGPWPYRVREPSAFNRSTQHFIGGVQFRL